MGAEFTLWAPLHPVVILRMGDALEQRIPMQACNGGYHVADIEGACEGLRYAFETADGTILPDPASRCQSEGVHAPSRLADWNYPWRDDGWRGLPWRELSIYEVHVGTFTPEGTFAGVIRRIPYLRDLGVNAVEIMPVAQFPGERNWGYDGVYPYAVQHSYGGLRGFQAMVDACHRAGLAVILDVVYNHLGPEGNYLGQWGPYFTDRYKTPWGQAVNFDGEGSDEVRRFFVENALFWLRDCRVDGLRLDAVHAMFDQRAHTFFMELSERVAAESARSGRVLHLIAESDLNNPAIIRPVTQGGWGMDAMWCDDFHHATHTLLTGEAHGYYADFDRPAELLFRALSAGFAYSGQYAAHRRRSHGAPLAPRDRLRLVSFIQNHDQIGNRMLGDRLASLVSEQQLFLAASLLLLAPHTPLLFMGEEYGETTPFLYFVSHGDPDLVEAVRRGRTREFAWLNAGDAPDPQSPDTFRASVPNVPDGAATRPPLWAYYRSLLQWRARWIGGGVVNPARAKIGIGVGARSLSLRYVPEEEDGASAFIVWNLTGEPEAVSSPRCDLGWHSVPDISCGSMNGCALHGWSCQAWETKGTLL